MNITKAKYIKPSLATTNTAIVATINNIEMSVPLDPDNRHYQAILKWVAEGNTIAEAD